MLHPKKTINCKGRLISLEKPLVMGILNVTPDSFFDGGRHATIGQALKHTEKMLEEGAMFIDVGGMSSRPGAPLLDVDVEMGRVVPVVEALGQNFPDAIISIDTFRSKVAIAAVEAGAHIVNDISAGRQDEFLFETVANLGVPYILMHMQGTPATMQASPQYGDVVADVLDFFIQQVGELKQLGVKDILLDPGFGFGKTVGHNYQLLNNLHVFNMLELPVLAGISRKSMICKVLGVKPENALNGTTALHVIALQQGAKILRVHDVKEAVETIQLWQQAETYA
ncbi:MAG: dihydropteroate synthase [Lewinellaceae bacterium]|nr:dihydropteroate synthase [Saprospiraceae bacterium]MCB9339306.1 dihydropteroate synthase [Lewinellaceae bacterium]